MKKLGKNLEDKTILITGGTGSFGYQMTERLLKIPETEITIYSRDEDKQRVMQSYFHDSRIRFVLGDIRDADRLNESLKGIDIVLHAGALKQIPSVEFSPMEALKTNTISAYNIMKASDLNNVEQVIAISTDKACLPANSYGLSKAMMEKIILGDDVWCDNTKFGCVRYGNVLGSRGSVLPVWDDLIEQNKPIPITDNRMRRFFITLDQATDLILYATAKLSDKQLFVREAPALYIKDLALVYAELKTGKKNYPQKEIGIRTGEKLDEVLISKEEMSKSIRSDKLYRIISRKEHADYEDEEYSSANTQQLGKKEIKKLIEGLIWKK
jgi:UDP-glucose 4-epimerase